ncbi:MAG: MoaD/ThiS family protein [Thermoplasmata archaeon]
MEITLRLLKPLKDSVGRDRLSLEVEKGSIKSLWEKLSQDHPRLAKEILDEKGELDYRVNVIINDKPLTDLNVELREGDLVTLFIPISGGLGPTTSRKSVKPSC